LQAEHSQAETACAFASNNGDHHRISEARSVMAKDT
jgi:hypothetical protein